MVSNNGMGRKIGGLAFCYGKKEPKICSEEHRSENIATGQAADQSHQHNFQIKAKRPVGDVIEVEVGAPAGLFHRVNASPHAIYLCPTGNPRFDAMASGILQDDL